jgi:hypothetical protein
VIGIPDYPIGIKDKRFFRAALVAPVKEKENNDGDKGNDASSSSASNRTNIAASRTRWGIRYNDNRRLNSGGNYETIGLR